MTIHETDYIADAWFVEVYGRVVATYETREQAQSAIDGGLYHWAYPYLTHGPARRDALTPNPERRTRCERP